MQGLEFAQRTSACRRSRLIEAGAQGWEPLSLGVTLPNKQSRRTRMKIACLNVQGCNNPAKRECVGRLFEERGLDVLVLSETKLKGSGEKTFGNVVGRVSGVSSGSAREGVCIIVGEAWKGCVREWKEVSSRLMYVRMKVGVDEYVIVGAYGPGSERTKEERESFWSDLGELVGSFENDEIVCVLGDLNARVGDNKVQGVIGEYGVPGVNESGEWMIDWCMQYEMTVCNTLFNKRDVHKFTWVRRVRGEIVESALMDYMCVSGRYKARVTDVNVLRAAGGVHSDHHLVVCKVKVKRGWAPARPTGGVREVVKVERLNDAGCREEFEGGIREEWLVHKETELGNVEEEWMTFKNAVRRCASRACGMKRLSKRGIRKGSEWWNEEVARLVRRKRDLYRIWLQNRGRDTYDRYKMARNEVKRAVRRAKREADVRWGEKLVEDFSTNKRMFWREVKRTRKGVEVREECVKDENGRVLSEVNEVCERWKEYFDGLLNVSESGQAEITARPGMNVRVFEKADTDITMTEVVAAVSRLGGGKASGVDEVKGEYLRSGGNVCAEWMVRLLNVCLSSGKVPNEWKTGCIVPLYKGKGDPLECKNNRGISLLSVPGKVYGRILIERVIENSEGQIGEEQSGFRKGRSCADQIFVLRQVCEKMKEKKKRVFVAFMDLEKAYDRVEREAMWQVMRIYGIGGRVLKGIMSFYDEGSACVRVGNKVSESFGVRMGLRQGCVMSPWLFNIFMDGVVREVYSRVNGVGVKMREEGEREWVLSQLLFADDTALVAESAEQLQCLVGEFGRVCKRRKLRVNVEKSKVMCIGGSEDPAMPDIMLNGERMEVVSSFKYLGSCFGSGGGVKEDVSMRVAEGMRTFGAMKRVWRGRSVTVGVKRELYERIVVPTVMYGSESWGMRVEERNKLDVAEMNCLRNMCGVTRWDRWRNEVVRERVGVPEALSKRVDRKVLKWFGHVERMGNERLTKRVYRSEVGGVRGRGRPPFRWIDGVRRACDERGFGLDQAREECRDRNAWRSMTDRRV